MIKKFISLVRKTIEKKKKWPVTGDFRIKRHNDKTFPNHRAFKQLGKTKLEKAQTILSYCKDKSKYQDIIPYCEEICYAPRKKVKRDLDDSKIEFGFVYLIKIKSFKGYKIGRSGDARRRRYDIGVKLPEKPEIIHKIRTDDAIALEKF